MNVYLISHKGTFWFAEKGSNACINWAGMHYTGGVDPTNIARFDTSTDALQWLETHPSLALVSFPNRANGSLEEFAKKRKANLDKWVDGHGGS